MNKERTPSESVVHAAKLYHDHVICPSESWRAINDATQGLDLISLLNDLDSSDQELVRKIYLERPLSLQGLAESYIDSQFPVILKWCITDRHTSSITKTFHTEITINATLEKCWTAWTDKEVAKLWLGLHHSGTSPGDDYLVSNDIPYLTGRHKILEIVPEKELTIQWFIDSWPGKLSIQFEAQDPTVTKLIIDVSTDIADAPENIEPLANYGKSFYFVQGSWNHVLFEMRSLLEDEQAGVIIAPDNNDHLINLSIDIAATPQKLYKALLDPETLKLWAGNDFILKGAEINPVVDGTYCYGWYPKGTAKADLRDGPSQILKLKENKQVVHNWHGGDELAEITWVLEDRGNGVTSLTFTHNPLLGFSHGNVWSYRSGWSEIIYSLKWYAERNELNKAWVD